METRNNQVRIKLNQQPTSSKKVAVENGLGFEWKKTKVEAKPEKVEQPTSDISEEKKFFLPPITIFTRVVLPIAIALIIGLGLGLSALKIASYQSSKQNRSSQDNQTSAKASASGTSPYSKKLSNYVIQGGVFSTKEAAKTQQAKLTSDVPNVIVKQNDQYLLLLGLSGTMAAAKEDAQRFQQANIAAYAKQMQVSGNTQKAFTNAQKETIAMIEQNFIELRGGLMLLKSGQPITEMHVTDLPTTSKDEKLTELLKLNQKNIAAFDDLQSGSSLEKLVSFEQNLLSFFQFYLNF